MTGGPHATRKIGRYELHGEIASGGMATVHYGRLLGDGGFSRTVAIKRLHAAYGQDPEFLTMLLDEARLAARVSHPNVVQTLDVVTLDDEVFVVLEHVLGEPLSRVLAAAGRTSRPLPIPVVAAIVCDVLHGLHAAHEAKNERGERMDLVHRDVSPQNVIVGADGASRVLDFGVAKAAGRVQTTRDGQVKGKLAYMAPEQMGGGAIDRRVDVYAAGIVLWEALTGRRLFGGANEADTLRNALERAVPTPCEIAPDIPAALGELTLRALACDPSRRFATAQQMASAIEECVTVARPAAVAEVVDDLVGAAIAKRSAAILAIEATQTRPSRPQTDANWNGNAEGRASPTLSAAAGPTGASAATPPPTVSLNLLAPRRTVAPVAVIAALVSVGIVALAEYRRFSGTGPEPPAPPAGTALPSAAQETASPTGPVAPAAAEAAPSAPLSTPPRVERSGTTRPAAPAQRATPAARRHVSGCDPPFSWVDGVKVPKPHCP